MDAPSQDTAEIEAAGELLTADIRVPASPRGLVIFAHGSGSSRLSPRNRQVAAALNDAGLATVLIDLLSEREESIDRRSTEYRFDIGLLARRLGAASEWARQAEGLGDLPMGYFGASTGAAAALVAAAERRDIRAVVSRGGRPDMAGPALPAVDAPTLLIVGQRDPEVIGLNREALAKLRSEARLEIVADATHLFEEPGALERVSSLARQWFVRQFASDT